jgi:hypothetical protein
MKGNPTQTITDPPVTWTKVETHREQSRIGAPDRVGCRHKVHAPGLAWTLRISVSAVRANPTADQARLARAKPPLGMALSG